MSLQVQVHITMPKPAAGVVYSHTLLDEIANAWLKGKKLPKQIKVNAISYRTGPNGAWTETREPTRMKTVREDFRFVTEAGFSFTGVSSVG